MKVSTLFLISATLPLVLLGTSQITQKKFNESSMKWTHFECGFQNLTDTKLQFSMQFFFVSILFLIFDMEIALVLSFPLEMSTNKNLSVLLGILVILTSALVYEWQKSKISWSK